MATVEKLSLDELCKEYALIFKKVHRIRCAMQQAEVDRLEWLNRFREWMGGQKDPEGDETVAGRQQRDAGYRALSNLFSKHDPYPHMPTPDLEAEKRQAELHHLIAKAVTHAG